ncbi:AAA family ATPase [Elioraea sp.]|uniref:AAA family ATPase n=1 Tax=Elioraea sp. TaxID=2185103 RepID=UPI0021DBEA5A|nr:AAA family ATPase [Elioraea sp.]GIX12025.1 MAG: transposase [Elioraea sp.]
MTSETPSAMPTEDQVRDQARAFMRAEGLSQKALSVLCAIPYGTLSAWMGGSYAGRGERIAEAVLRGIEARRAQRRTRALAPKAPGFVATPTAEAITGCLEHAQHMPDLAVVTGGPGVGKTTSAQAYRARTPNVWLLTGEPVHGSPRALLEDLAEALGLAVSGVSSQRLSRAIVQRVRGTGGLIVVDEAQHLTSTVLDQLRTLHDLAEIGVALLGNETVHARLEGGARAAHYAQLYSRVGMRLARPRPLRTDVDALLDAWSVEGQAERALLHAIARKPGGLRGVTKVLRLAHMLAAAEEAAVGERHLRLAWSRYASQDAVEEDALAARRAA